MGGYLAIRPFCLYGREAAIMLMPPLLAAALLLMYPRTRRVRPGALLVYAAVMIGVIAVTITVVSRIAGGVVIPVEVALVTYSAFGWRLAWQLWSRTVGLAGQKHVRLARLRRRRRGSSAESAAGRVRDIFLHRGIPLARISATALIFLPLFLSTVLTLRLKIGNSFTPETYAGMDYEEASFETSDGVTLHGWYIPSPRAESTVVICHGLGANKGNFFEFVRLFYSQRHNALIFDFRGHGDSGGHTSGMGLLEHRDVLAAVRWLKRAHPEGARRVYGLGSSMGAAALLRAAVQDVEIEAVILDSCYASADLLARQHLGKLPVIGDLYGRIMLTLLGAQLGESPSNLDPLSAITCLEGRPVLLIHAAEDRLIPAENLNLLYDAADEPKGKWLAPGSHSNVLTADFDRYQDRVLAFLEEAGRRQRP